MHLVQVSLYMLFDAFDVHQCLESQLGSLWVRAKKHDPWKLQVDQKHCC